MTDKSWEDNYTGVVVRLTQMITGCPWCHGTGFNSSRRQAKFKMKQCAWCIRERKALSILQAKVK